MIAKLCQPIQIPACISGIIHSLELCLDASYRATNRGREWSDDAKEQWLWIEDALMTPAIQLLSDDLDAETTKYMACLLRDYHVATYIETPSEERKRKRFAGQPGLFAEVE